MADSCPECIHIVPVSSARVCGGRSGWRERRGIRFCPPSQAGRTKTLLSPCQHSSAQRDFIDQRTAMQEPLLHPSDTIYHAASSPPSCALFFSPRRLSEHPVMQKRQKKLPKKEKKKLAHSGANHRGFNAKPVTFLQHITNGLFPEAPKATS